MSDVSAENKIIFQLDGREYIELNNLLKFTGLSTSGGEAKALISDSNVKVDGQIELRKRCKLRVNQRVTLGDVDIIIKE